MKPCWILALLCCTIPAFALSGGMEKATVHAMRKVPCAEGQGSGHGGFLSGFASVSAGPGTVGECIEYELYTAKVSYIIRPNRAILLLLGGDVSIKLAGDELLLRSSEAPKNLRCAVLAMSLLSDAEKTGGSDQLSPRCYSRSGREYPCLEEPDPR